MTKVLDCTLRDGGYYNNWDFAPDTVRRYLEAVGNAAIDVVEIGLRSPAQKGYAGPFAYCSDAFLDTLAVPETVTLGVMINASQYRNGDVANLGLIDRLFGERSTSRVGLVRIAAHYDEVDAARGIAEHLKHLGYTVGFNLMQVGGRPQSHVSDVARRVAAWETVDVLYFADSLGNMGVRDVEDIVAALRTDWTGALGIHAHDNMSAALGNTLRALELGVEWLDATIFGMGRGAGNTRTEYLLIELERRGHRGYHPDALFPLVLGPFNELQRAHQWGPNLFYFLSGAYKIHPSYVQEMLSSTEGASDHALHAMKQLRDGAANSYSLDRLRTVLQPQTVSYPGRWSAKGWADGRTVLIVANGPWIKLNARYLADYIDRTRPLVISLNTNSPLPAGRISVYAACHAFRFAMEADHYLELDAPLVAPSAALPTEVTNRLDDSAVLDYGMTVGGDRFAFDDTGCTIPRRLAAAYALALANAAGARNILLAGFDGYGASNPLQDEMEYVFACYRATAGTVPVTAVTPTTYSIEQSSLFTPEPWDAPERAGHRP
ncbi:MAG: aldolase catalytic domain-containing protein [Magnetospirillum sp.]|nr:aldolase catalytic domain-containing protein [Magnetospirillum sp.]